MKPSKDISNELNEMAPLLSKLDKKNFYEVSEGYFEESAVKMVGLAEDIHAHSIVLPPVLASLEKREQYSAPEGYFAVFSDKVMGQIHAEEVSEELSYAAPLLVGLSKKETMAVPSDYFTLFPVIATKVAAKEAEIHDTAIEHGFSIWSIWSERAFNIIMRPAYSFALACMFATAMLMSVVFTHSTLTPEEKIFAQMQQLPDSDLHHYMAKHRDDFDERTILHHIDDIEFTHYFDKPENMPEHLKNEIKGMSDDINEDIID